MLGARLTLVLQPRSGADGQRNGAGKSAGAAAAADALREHGRRIAPTVVSDPELSTVTVLPLPPPPPWPPTDAVNAAGHRAGVERQRHALAAVAAAAADALREDGVRPFAAGENVVDAGDVDRAALARGRAAAADTDADIGECA